MLVPGARIPCRGGCFHEFPSMALVGLLISRDMGPSPCKWLLRVLELVPVTRT